MASCGQGSASEEIQDLGSLIYFDIYYSLFGPATVKFSFRIGINILIEAVPQ